MGMKIVGPSYNYFNPIDHISHNIDAYNDLSEKLSILDNCNFRVNYDFEAKQKLFRWAKRSIIKPIKYLCIQPSKEFDNILIHKRLLVGKSIKGKCRSKVTLNDWYFTPDEIQERLI